MALEDLRPAGFTEAMQTFARWSRRAKVYAQGMWSGEYAIWLRIDGSAEIMLGIGQPEDVLLEALGRLDELKQQAENSLIELMQMKHDRRPPAAPNSEVSRVAADGDANG